MSAARRSTPRQGTCPDRLKSVDDARSVLVQNKLGLGSTTEQYSDQPAGTIIGQSPAAGSTVKVNRPCQHYRERRPRAGA